MLIRTGTIAVICCIALLTARPSYAQPSIVPELTLEQLKKKATEQDAVIRGLNAMIQVLQQQRNAALDQTVQAVGQLSASGEKK